MNPDLMDIRNRAEQADTRIPHILVVDDEKDILQMITLCLVRDGYRVSLASSSEEAYIKLNEIDCDTIITDVMMPGEDGITFLGNVHQRMPDVPVIIMTGYAQLQIAVNAIKNGAFDFIHKPFDFTYLRKVVTKAIHYRHLTLMEKNYHEELEKMVTCRTQELMVSLAELDAARTGLQKAAAEKSKFLATITHEMRTPMNGVIGGLDLLADSGLQGAQTEYLLLTRQAADNMVALVDRMLNFADRSPQNSRADLIDLTASITTFVKQYHECCAEKGLSFLVHRGEDLPGRIRCDWEQLARLLDILLGNAIKFTDKGEIRLDISLLKREDSRAVIRFVVSDSGIGIPADMLERVFEPFTQVDGSSTRRFGGAGLGLSIARQIAQLLNGQLHVESRPGEGSCFQFDMNVESH